MEIDNTLHFITDIIRELEKDGGSPLLFTN